MSPCSKLSKQWEFLDFGSGPSPRSDWQSFLHGLDVLGPCMDLSMHVPHGYLTMVFDRLPMDANTAYVLESRLISMDGATQIPISGFEASRWHNSWVWVWYFQGLWIPKLPTGQIIDLGKKLQLLTHKLRPDYSWAETHPLLCLKFSTSETLKHLKDLNLAWDWFRACFPWTNRLVPAFANAHGWTSFWSCFAPV